MINIQLYRPAWMPALVTALLLMVALGLLVGMAWRSLARIQPVHGHLAELGQLQAATQALDLLVLNAVSEDAPLDRARLAGLADELAGLPALTRAPERQVLRSLRGAARESGADPARALTLALTARRDMGTLLVAETRAHDELLKSIDHDTRVELKVASALIIGFPALGVLVLYLLRNRILRPLRNLTTLLALLGQREYAPAPSKSVEPLLRPLFENYNTLVRRLRALEREHQAREDTLAQEVRAATTALLDQSRALARSERLAAVGEVAAGLAHELRNPLAGIQLACAKLRRQTSDPDQARRLDVVNNELNRLTRRLNDLLAEVREAPEPPQELELHQTIGDLLELIRFQVPSDIRLENQIPAGLRCRLPEGHLRQALLNLILNAAQALEKGPGLIVLDAEPVQDALRIRVCDDGPGFPAELLRNGVRAFATWRDDGTGLGLAMVRRFARDLGGELELANREPHGACASLRLPAELAHG